MGKKKEVDNRMKMIGEKLRLMRKEAGYSNYDHLAYDLDISRNQLSRIERGENITLSTLLFMFDAYGISPAEFFADITEKKTALLEKVKL